MNFRINTQFAAIAILFSTSSLMGDDIKPATPAPAAPAAAIPDIAPFLVPSLEEKYSTEANRADAITAKAEAEAAKLKKLAADARLKGYKDKLAEITKTGDFDKAQQVKARITQLENEPEGESHKPTKRPRPKDTVKFGGHVYALIKEPATWHVAKQRCEEMGGHLVCIESEAEEKFIKSLCGQSNVWVGATDEEVEGQWKWVSGATPVRLTINFSDANSEHHLSLYNSEWHDGPDGHRHPYVCEWQN